jgi:hypothetical protein
MKNHRDYDPRTESLDHLAFAQFVDPCDQKDLEDRRQIHRHFFEGSHLQAFRICLLFESLVADYSCQKVDPDIAIRHWLVENDLCNCFFRHTNRMIHHPDISRTSLAPEIATYYLS